MQHGADIPVTFVDGDRLGARAYADGTVEVFRNDQLLATRDVSSWPYYADGGYIGLWFIGAEDAILDDFGGGTLEGGEGLMGRGEENSLSGEGLDLQENSGVEYDPFNVEVSNAGGFHQGIPADLAQDAVVTFTSLSEETGKPQGNGLVGEGVTEVVYDIPGGTIRLWANDPETGWHQVGKSIPAEFAAGDQFSVRIAEDGWVEIYQNGALLARRMIRSAPGQEGAAVSTPHPAAYRLPMHMLARPVSLAVPAMPEMLLQQPNSLTIDYTYDALNRPTSAIYSDGRTFGYAYDAAGNVLEYEQNLGPGTVTTTYSYDAANQLLDAQQGSTTTQYTYDANGSLTSDGVKTYTYDYANRLIEVNNQSSVVSLEYNGLGQRLSMSAAGVTTYYAMSGDYPLSAEASGNTTFYLYGLGVIGEKTNAWSYSLPDGLNTPRQLTDPTGEVTFSARYTPWGDTLETYGTGNFAFGYFGGVMDAATGLLYVGNGQYYDSATGRFLTRDAKPSQSNPYVPFDPTGALFAPLGLLALFYGRRRKHGKWDTLLVLLVLASAVGIGLAACGTSLPSTPSVTATPISTATPPTVTSTPTPAGPRGDDNTGVSTPTAPVGSPTPNNMCSQIIAVPDEAAINTTIKDLADFVFGVGNGIKAISANANRLDVEGYLKRLMEAAGTQGLNTNHLAYIYATTHVESGWGDFEEKYEGDPNQYFDNLYGPQSILGPQLGNTEDGDGYRYMGRGFIHLTGRANYLKIGQLLGLGTELKDFPYRAECGMNCNSQYDYVTNIAVIGMKSGSFTSISLLSSTLNGQDGSFDFYAARQIIGWPGNSSSQQAGDLGIGFANILTEHCLLGGVSSGVICVDCR